VNWKIVILSGACGAIFAVVSLGMLWAIWRRRNAHSSKIFMAWELQVLADGWPHSLDEIRNFLAFKSGLTQQQIQSFLSRRMRERWDYRISCSLDDLHELGLAYQFGPGFYKLTKMGLLVATQTPSLISRKYLRRFPEFIHWESERKHGYFGRKSFPPPGPSIPSRLSFMGDMPEPDPNLLDDPRNVQVWFGTNCKPNDPFNIAMGFSHQRGRATHFGRCVINIPGGHITGTTKPTLFEAWIKGTQGIVVKAVEGMRETDFWTKLGEALAPAVEDNSLLFFVHGYRVGFLEAAIRTAQLKYDLKIPHAAFYSWPSKVRLIGYGGDVASSAAAKPLIADFLSRLGSLTASRNIKLHVVAHSMGNYALLLALERILLNLNGAAPNFKLAEVVFAAPDVDPDIFKDYVARTTAMSRQRTLYASQKDVPLGFSGRIHYATRAGKIPPVTLVDKTDTVDVTNIDLSTLGHGYVAEARPVVQDMFVAMHFGAPPAQRQGLVEKKSDGGTHWVIQ
jgi:esterase/lipase superfamily enzyme